MSRGMRRGRQMVIAGVLVAAVAVGGGVPAPAQAPVFPAVDFVEGFVPPPFGYLDCDGVLHTEAETYGYFFVELDDEVLVDTDLSVSFTGSLVDDLVEVPTVLTVFAGESYGEVEFAFAEAEAGDSITMAVQPGVGYEADPLDDTATVVVDDEPEIVVDCNEDLGTPPDGTDRQTIEVGQRPAPLGFFGGDVEDEDDYPFGAFDTDVGVTQVANGALPPGLTYDDDVWGGAATTVGTYAFDVRLCIDTSRFDDEVSEDGGEEPEARALRQVRAIPTVVCLGTVDVEIVVEAAATSPGAARPATPVTARARFAG